MTAESTPGDVQQRQPIPRASRGTKTIAGLSIAIIGVLWFAGSLTTDHSAAAGGNHLENVDAWLDLLRSGPRIHGVSLAIVEGGAVVYAADLDDDDRGVPVPHAVTGDTWREYAGSHILEHVAAIGALMPDTQQGVVVMVNAGSQFEVGGERSAWDRLPQGIVNLVRDKVRSLPDLTLAVLTVASLSVLTGIFLRATPLMQERSQPAGEISRHAAPANAITTTRPDAARTERGRVSTPANE